jgi:hypothetical protein
MTQQFHFLERCVGALVFAAAITTSAVASAGPVVNVADVEQLYLAVNEPLNKGAAVVLAPGIYLLSAKDQASNDRPHGGRLELQKDMSLYGVAGDRAAVVIDGSALPTESFTTGVSFGRSGVVRIGIGTNTIEWLTVLGNPAAAAGIATELTDPAEPIPASTTIRVAHVVSDGSSRGIDVRNAGQGMIRRRIDAELVDNELIGPTEPLLPNTTSEGIRLANFVNADRGVIVAILSGNRAYGFQLGCIVANNRSSNAALQVRSSGDRFFANNLGCQIAGGLSQAITGVANSNSTVFEAFGTEFVDNTAQIGGAIDPGPGGLRGGIRVVGGLSTMLTNVVSDNTVSVSLTGSKVFGNQVVDFDAFGAIQTALTGIAGTNNRVTITLRGVSSQIDPVTADSLPVDPSSNNTVTVLSSPAP